jgi:hypothetical protein
MSSIDGKNNYCVYIGDDFRATLTVKLKGTDTVVDMTGYSFKMQIRRCKDNDDLIHELSSPAPNGIDITDAANGIIVLTIPSSVTLTIEEQNAVYDLYWVDTVGEIKTISRGSFRFLERVTKN